VPFPLAAPRLLPAPPGTIAARARPPPCCVPWQRSPAPAPVAAPPLSPARGPQPPARRRRPLSRRRLSLLLQPTKPPWAACAPHCRCARCASLALSLKPKHSSDTRTSPPKGATSLHSLSHFIVLSWKLMLSLVSSCGRLLVFNSALLLVAQGFRACRNPPPSSK